MTVPSHPSPAPPANVYVETLLHRARVFGGRAFEMESELGEVVSLGPPVG